ncbi:MAG: DoxX family protein [Pseudomonadota bacterium]
MLRWFLGAAYAYAGYAHLARPEPFLAITPGWVPYPQSVVFWTGFAEIAGAIGLIQPISRPLRSAAGLALAFYALCVWPANIHHFTMDMAREDEGLGLGYHIPRLLLQPVLIWLALWVGEVSGPWTRRKQVER